jgi:hypothetical protein
MPVSTVVPYGAASAMVTRVPIGTADECQRRGGGVVVVGGSEGLDGALRSVDGREGGTEEGCGGGV